MYPAPRVLAAVLFAVAALVPLRSFAQAPSGGVPLITDPLNTFRTTAARGPSEIVTVRGPGFERAIRVTVDGRGEAWEVELGATITRPVGAGDVGLLHFWARNAAPSRSSQAVFTVYAQRASPDWVKSLFVDLAVGEDWREYYLPWRWTASYGAGGSMVAFGMGRLPQTVEIGGLEVLEYPATPLESLPRTPMSYEGRDETAEWRKDAERRIEEIRTGALTVRVVDGAGRPIRNADVSVEMQRHAFPFGSALTANLILGQTDTNQLYREHVVRLFNAGTLENDLKWPAWDGDWGPDYARPRSLAALQWMKSLGFNVRGHVLVWPSWDNLPRVVTRHRGTELAPVFVPQMILLHIDDLTKATAPWVDEWDVVNEPFANHDVMDLAGWGVVAEWFNRARANLPDAPLYLNDYGMLSEHGANLAHQDFNKDLIASLKLQGAAISGLGMQGHMGPSPTAPVRVREVLDQFAALGVPIRITEFDVDTDDEQLQADYTRDFMTMVFSHPAVHGFQLWGFWEGAHWRPRAAMYRTDWTEKPSGAAYRELVFGRWWTRASGTTNRRGDYEVRGFYGDYRITAAKDGRSAEATFALTRGGEGSVTITLR